MLFDRLVSAYAAEGLTLRSSISPFMVTRLNPAPAEDGQLTRAGRADVDWFLEPGDLGLPEICFLEALGRARPARRVLVLGAGFGWASCALALANPGARVAALGEAGGKGPAGVAILRSIAAREGLAVAAEAGELGAAAALAAAHLGGPADLVLIDQRPPSGRVSAAYAGAAALAAADAIHLFHGLFVGGHLRLFAAIAREARGHAAHVLARTPGAMGALVPEGADARVARVVAGFSDPFVRVPL